jgi:hypothetical protein
MTRKLIQWKARELQARTRKRLLATWTGPVCVFALYWVSLRIFPALPEFVHALFTCAILWSVAGLFVIARGLRSATIPKDAGASTGLAFCREEIARRRLLEGRQLLWSFAPLLMAVLSVIVGLVSVAGPRETSAKGLPFLLLVATWIGAYCVLRYRDRRALDGELAELDEIEHDA